MFNKIITIIAVFVTSCIHSEIVETYAIDDVRSYIQKDALYLFDIDETLIDNSTALGRSPWRNWIRSNLPKYHIDFELFDALTLYIAQNIPYNTVEPTTAKLISDLQDQKLAVFAFTARGRSEWYKTQIEGIDRFTHDQLKYAGIDFSNTEVPVELESIDRAFFHEGIIFAEHIKKGDLIKRLFSQLSYKPSFIIFVDDKLEQAKSVEAALKEIGIPFIVFWYRGAELKHGDFNLMVANIQLAALLQQDIALSDEESAKIAKSITSDPETYLKEILDGINLQTLYPSFSELLIK